MGNSTSSGRGHHEDTVDFGYLCPQGVYSGARDWNQAIVTQLICERKLAPFYRPLEDYDESWDDEQILSHRKEPPPDAEGQAESSGGISRTDTSSSRAHKRGHASSNSKEVIRHPEAAIYRGAVECPICFLYYPPNINHSRCCDQTICTECFVQIKRAEPNPTHLISEPAACPYCVRENFGVVYTPPPWRTGLNSEGATPPSWPDTPTLPASAVKRSRKSFGPDSPEVVSIADQIRPDWEAKLAAVRAAVARRANRRIIMRQVGDRLIPVGISSGRVHPLAPEDGQAEGGEGSAERGTRRSRRRQQNQDINQLLGTMGLGGQDLEELMVMEAMRLSLIEHEEQQRREREAEEKKKREQAAEGGQANGSEGAGSSSAAAATPEPTPSPPADAASSSGSTLTGAVTADATSVTSAPAAGERNASTPVTPVPEHASLDQSTMTSPITARANETVLSSPSSSSDTTVGDGDQPATPTSSSGHDGDVRPVSMNRTESFASSLAASAEPSNYDMLSSSPESAISHKPLLRSRPASPPLVADSSASAQ
ncbi:uncharacterized protein LAESUDRAFT_659458 [Laetiporus sulphureus 93-53]|uniref:RING-type domain-containing protein n=1 Tax=Laetiporus sulphureus 93-53 TaxID=1314785 RepID=A0A165CV72_9APHY|nr:uncharacterized protein LAESUDRAFT_659458 [Laetiporus sulphureus 93-53]KZT03487.1 hypothetical protein LAESUDRAFT_659458 [Laetiporus sulphureus 93-53]